jgi:DNA-directed RNA polymerase specialized sigma24 family protein
MDALDEQLKQLALAAQKHTYPLLDSQGKPKVDNQGNPKMGLTSEGKKRVNELWEKVWRSGRLYRPPKDRLPGNYQDIYDDAVLQLMQYTLRNIHKYDPARSSVMGWLNMKLDRTFLRDQLKQIKKERVHHLSLADLDNDDGFSGNRIDRIPAPESKPSHVEFLRKYLSKDPDGLLDQSIKKYPHIRLKDIAEQYIVHGCTLQNIANREGIPNSTLNSFFHRKMQPIYPFIKQYIDRCIDNQL